ncbi:MAG: hypothetical protein CMH56_11515 [Myxococcales bacterium]|nr:hypothetical protein [Myxococcales bacterium]
MITRLLHNRASTLFHLLGVGWLCCLLSAQAVEAKNIEIKISASHEVAAVGDDIELKVEFVQRKTGNLSNLKMPQFRGFVERGRTRSNSSSVRIVNGRRTMETTYIFNIQLTAQKKGNHRLGPARATLGDEKASSNTVTVRVIAGADPLPPMPATTAEAMPSYLQDIEARYQNRPLPRTLLHVAFDKTEAVVGEQITATVRVLSTESLSNVSRPEYPKLKNFLSESMDQPSQIVPTDVRLKGQNYQSYLIERTALFPLEPGQHHLKNVTLETNMAGGFFRRGKKLNLKSQSYMLDIQNLPAMGQPPNFPIHNVGQWGLAAEVDRRKTKKNEPITLKIYATGEGSARQLQLPSIQSTDAYRAFPPTYTENTNASSGRVIGMKTMEVLIQPKQQGRLKLGPFAMPFFDPVSNTYTNAQTKPVFVRVTAAANEGQKTTAQSKSEQTLRPLTMGITPVQGNRFPFNVQSLIFTFMGGWLLCMAICLLLVLRNQNRGSLAYAKRQVVHERLQQLKNAQSENEVGVALEVLYDHMAFLFGERVKSLPVHELASHLEAQGCHAATAQEAATWFDEAQQQRYAPPGMNSATDLLSRALSLFALLNEDGGDT